MSDDNSQEKTQDPTEKRLRDAKDKGQVLRSKELMTMMVTLAAALTLYGLGSNIISHLIDIMREGLSFDYAYINQPDVFYIQAKAAFMKASAALVPFMVICALSAGIAPIILGGVGVNLKTLMPKLERLDPLKGIKKIVSIKGLVELGKSFLKFVLIAAIAIIIFNSELGTILQLNELEQEQAMTNVGKMLAWSFILLCGGLVVISAIDVPFQIQQHNQQLKMSMQELKDESKETDGSPELKQRLRQQQQEHAQARSVDKVPAADVIITNPEHFAVAIVYQQGVDDAPKVIAKGCDQIALLIKEAGKHAKKPIIESPPLARAIYHTTDIGLEIPFGLYKAVAQVLTYIYQLDEWYQRGGNKPVLAKPDFDRKAFNY